MLLKLLYKSSLKIPYPLTLDHDVIYGQPLIHCVVNVLHQISVSQPVCR